MLAVNQREDDIVWKRLTRTSQAAVAAYSRASLMLAETNSDNI